MDANGLTFEALPYHLLRQRLIQVYRCFFPLDVTMRALTRVTGRCRLFRDIGAAERHNGLAGETVKNTVLV